jgi:hypothetical protein
MNIFVPNDPNAVILVGTSGEILEVAQNIAPDFQVKIVTTRAEFRREAGNKPFRTDRLPQPEQVHSLAASKERYAVKA